MSSCCNWPWSSSSSWSSSSCGCSWDPNVYNCNDAVISCNNAAANSILNGLDYTISTCSDAINWIAERLAKRVHGTVIVTRSSDILYNFSVQTGGKIFTSSITLTSGCLYPVTATYSKNGHTGSASFADLEQMLSWLSMNLQPY